MLTRNIRPKPEPSKGASAPSPAPSSHPATEAVPRRRDPSMALAEQMLSAALAVVPEAWEIGRGPGAVVIARVAPGWGDLISNSWLTIVHERTPVTAENFDEVEVFETVSRRGHHETPATLVAAVDDTGQASWRQLTEDRVKSALHNRGGLFVALEGDRDGLPSLSAASDLEIVIPPPTGAMLAAVASQLANGHAAPLPDELAAVVMPFDVICVLRPQQSAEDYLRRLTRLLEAKAATQATLSVKAGPTWTLDTLPLAPDVEAWARQVAADLAAYGAGTLPWHDIEHGALLSGPPGCGKTTLASALAASCGVPLIVTSYAAIESGADGKGRYYDILKNLRATFAAARAAAPCILLFDEIDSIPARGQAGHNESWFAPINNTLLTETAVEAREGVVFLGATNYPERVDPALRRSGRLDRLVQIDLPDIVQLARILGAHCPSLSPEDRDQAAVQVMGHTGADIARVTRGARRRARQSGREVSLPDIVAELADGTEPRCEAKQRRVAVHEAGHTLVTELRRPGAVQAVTLRGLPSRPSVLGMSVANIPDVEETLDEIDGFLTELLAGRAAEELVLGSVSAGAVGDLRHATEMCAAIELTMGLGGRMTSLGKLDPDDVSRALLMDREVARAVEYRLRNAYEAVLLVLGRNRASLNGLVEALLAGGTLSRHDVELVLGAHRGCNAAGSDMPPRRSTRILAGEP